MVPKIGRELLRSLLRRRRRLLLRVHRAGQRQGLPDPANDGLLPGRPGRGLPPLHPLLRPRLGDADRGDHGAGAAGGRPAPAGERGALGPGEHPPERRDVVLRAVLFR